MAVIDAKKNFPLTTRRSVMIRPGYTVLETKDWYGLLRSSLFSECGQLGGNKGHTKRKHTISYTSKKKLLFWWWIPSHSSPKLFSGGAIFWNIKNICFEAFEIFYRLHAYWSAVSDMPFQSGMMMASAYHGFTPLWIPMWECATLLRPENLMLKLNGCVAVSAR